ncbi:MAG TPA: hypothetical protein VNX18_23380 [Bryobacteraceae bacterium]|nr:hypothetical protein [Bryobacteraceae bacterium]
MRQNLVVVAPALALLALLWGIFLGLCYARARRIPRCWKCGARKVQRSRFRGFLDGVAACWLLSPFRCTGCLTRFYGLRIHRSSVSRSF